MKVLMLVEDNLNDVIMAIRAFKSVLPDSEFVNAKTAEYALSYLETAARLPDLILIDLGLPPPDIDGLELIKRLKADKRFSTIPLAILTGWASEVVKLHALNVGLNYIIKPVDVTGFVTSFKTLLDKLGIQYATSV